MDNGILNWIQSIAKEEIPNEVEIFNSEKLIYIEDKLIKIQKKLQKMSNICGKCQYKGKYGLACYEYTFFIIISDKIYNLCYLLDYYDLEEIYLKKTEILKGIIEGKIYPAKTIKKKDC